MIGSTNGVAICGVDEFLREETQYKAARASEREAGVDALVD